MRSSYIFTSESVSEGHPDKVCDRISDEILDLYLSATPDARVACETMATTNRVWIAGEVRGNGVTQEQVIETARQAIKDIGYEQEGFHWQNVQIESHLHAQSADIARGVDSDSNKEEGAGDQGMMFGYATDETPNFMPAPIYYAHNIVKALATARRTGTISQLLPDTKSQVTLRYQDGRPVEVLKIVVSTQHIAGLSSADVADLILPTVRGVFPQELNANKAQTLINPTGQFIIGGPDGDCGLTGRKIIVDTYGGAAPHGGGAFSGKDPTKVDRSAAYACRYLAKNVVAAGLARRCTIQISYAIGVSDPLSFFVDLHGTGAAGVSEAALESLLPQLMSLTPRGIRTHLQLNRPIYARTAAYGHFGRTPGADGGFSWENTDLVNELRQSFRMAA